MKKKLFLALAMSIILVCLFVMGVSAAEYFGEVEIIDLDNDGESDISINNRLPAIISEGANKSADARATIKCACAAGKHTFPAYYLASPKNTGTRFYCFSYSDLNELLPQYCPSATTIDGTYITAYELPNGYKTIYSGFFYDGNTFAATSIDYFSFATCTTMTSLETTASGKNWFTGSSIKEIDLGSQITNIPVMLLYSCDQLLEVNIPDSITTIDRLAIYDCAELTAINITKTSQLTSLGANALSNNPKLEGLYLPSGLTVLGVSGSNQSPLQGNTKMYLKNSPDETTKPSVYYVPAGITSVVGEIFKNCKNLNDVIVFNENITSISDGWAFCGANSVTLVFLGDVESLSTSGAAWTKQTAIYFCNEADTGYTGNANVASKFVYCNAEGNTTHLKEKTEATEATCTQAGGLYDICFCGKAFAGIENPDAPALGHDKEGAVVTICYPTVNGVTDFFQNAIHSYTCQREDCGIKVDEVKAESALFTEKGYSKETYEGGSAFTYGIKLNKDAEKAYVENGNVVSYGFIIGAETDGGTNGNIMNADGTTNLQKYVLTDFAVSAYETFSIYNVRMFGLDETQLSQSVYCCAYVIDNGEVYYIGESITKQAIMVSYDGIYD